MKTRASAYTKADGIGPDHPGTVAWNIAAPDGDEAEDDEEIERLAGVHPGWALPEISAVPLPRMCRAADAGLGKATSPHRAIQPDGSAPPGRSEVLGPPRCRWECLGVPEHPQIQTSS